MGLGFEIYGEGVNWEEKDYKQGNTIVIVLLIPVRVARHVLRCLMMMLLPTLVEHLLEELELGICACEEEGCGEEGKYEACHVCCAMQCLSVLGKTCIYYFPSFQRFKLNFEQSSRGPVE